MYDDAVYCAAAIFGHNEEARERRWKIGPSLWWSACFNSFQKLKQKSCPSSTTLKPIQTAEVCRYHAIQWILLCRASIQLCMGHNLKMWYEPNQLAKRICYWVHHPLESFKYNQRKLRQSWSLAVATPERVIIKPEDIYNLGYFLFIFGLQYSL